MSALIWAQDFDEIAVTLQQRSDLVASMKFSLQLAMPGKVTEGGSRLADFRVVLGDLIDGSEPLSRTITITEMRLPRHTSPYAADNRVFASGWAERLVRTQLSRLYNQAALGHIVSSGAIECFVPHSRSEAPNTPCSIGLAGGRHNAKVLLNRLEAAYVRGVWSNDLKLPNHPHCTHVAIPV